MLDHPVITSGISGVLEYSIGHSTEYIIVVNLAHLPYNNQCLKPAMSVTCLVSFRKLKIADGSEVVLKVVNYFHGS